MKKTNHFYRFCALALSCLLLISLLPVTQVLADGDGAIHIKSAEDLRSLAHSCTLDSWSRGKTVVLDNDIELTDDDELPIPTFGGTFNGNGHTISGLSITKLFMIGLVPGILIGLALMVVWFFVVRKDGYNETITFTREEKWKILIDSTPAFLMPVLLLGGIRFGVFTPTEGGAFAAIYAIVVCVLYYRELSFRELLRVSARAATTTSVVMLIVATATAVGWFITIAQIPNQMTALFSPLIDSPVLLLLCINVFLFLIGMVMDLTPNILIFAPVFYPLITQAGIDPYYFGLLFILNLGIGVITPPVGTVLYVVCGIGNIKITQLIRNLVPFILVEVVMLFLLLFFPKLSLIPLDWLMGGK